MRVALVDALESAHHKSECHLVQILISLFLNVLETGCLWDSLNTLHEHHGPQVGLNHTC